MNDLKKQYIKQTEEKNKRRERGGIYKEFPTDLWKDTHTRLKTMDWIENKSLDKSFNEKSYCSYRGSRRSWRAFAVLGAGTGVRHGRALLLNSLKTHINTESALCLYSGNT